MSQTVPNLPAPTTTTGAAHEARLTWKQVRKDAYLASASADKNFTLPRVLEKAPWEMAESEFDAEVERYKSLSPHQQLRELSQLYFVEEKFRSSERNAFRPAVLVAVTATLALLALTFVPAVADLVTPWIPSVSAASENANSTAESFNQRLIELQPKFGQLSSTETRVLNDEADNAVAANQALLLATNDRPYLDVIVMLASAISATGIFLLWRHGRRRARFADYSRARAGTLIRLYEAIRKGHLEIAKDPTANESNSTSSVLKTPTVTS